MDIDAIQQIFFQECEEGLAGMEASFAALRAGDREPETINGVFRCVHSIKGGAGAFGHERLQAYTHQYETLLDRVRNGTLTLTPALLDLVMAAFDLLTDHVGAARDGEEAPADAAMLDRLAAASGGEASPAALEPAVEEAAPSVAAPDDFDDLMAMLGDVAAAPTAPVADLLEEPVEPEVADWLVDY
ncbi:Hpt domain-containing protein [Sphingomonas rubra]|uniref:Hpt domain-containing protein n=1 Tax=Sphingomonas rubra TaxID=634430 RepID=A0A1I5SN11_9SPHN|nr:Hpt domain-containing protein [Sphingomonas rubra]